MVTQGSRIFPSGRSVCVHNKFCYTSNTSNSRKWRLLSLSLRLRCCWLQFLFFSPPPKPPRKSPPLTHASLLMISLLASERRTWRALIWMVPILPLSAAKGKGARGNKCSFFSPVREHDRTRFVPLNKGADPVSQKQYNYTYSMESISSRRKTRYIPPPTHTCAWQS